MAKTPEKKYSEIDEIKKDLDSLKTNVVELTKHVKEDGSAQTRRVKKQAVKRWHDIQNNGKEQLENVENHVRKKPAQSMLAAFALGVAASFLLSGRR